MGVNQHAEHAERLVVFDKSHSSHVSGEVVNDASFSHCLLTGFFLTQVKRDVFGFWKYLKPVRPRFHVDTPNGRTLLQESSNEMTADEAPGAANNNFFASHFRN